MKIDLVNCVESGIRTTAGWKTLISAQLLATRASAQGLFSRGTDANGV